MATVVRARSRNETHKERLENQAESKQRHDDIENTLTRLDAVVDRLTTISEILDRAYPEAVTITTESVSMVKKGELNDSGATDSPGSKRTARSHKSRASRPK